MGFDGIGLWHADLEHILRERSLEEMREVLDANGMEHVELEFVGGWFLPEGEELRRAADERWEFLLDAAEALDARHVKVGNIRGKEAPKSRVADHFRRLCSDAADRDTLVGYEMMPVDPNVTTLDDALDVVGEPSNGGVLLDTWHVEKMGIPFEELTELSPENLVHVELNDGYESVASIVDQTTKQRMLPGEGTFDVPGFVEAVRASGYDGPWGVEVLSEYLRGLLMDSLFERSYEKTISQFESP